jgi:hypothetical protein
MSRKTVRYKTQTQVTRMALENTQRIRLSVSENRSCDVEYIFMYLTGDGYFKNFEIVSYLYPIIKCVSQVLLLYRL